MSATVALERFRSAIAAPRYPAAHFVALALLAFLVLWFDVYTLRPVQVVWREDFEYSHGYLVLLFTAWLCILEARRQPLKPLVPSATGLLCLVALVLATVAAAASTTLVVAAAALPALPVAALWAAAGAKIARRFAPRLAYLYFAMPIWGAAVEPLRKLAVLVVTEWIRAAKLPAFIDGNFIHVPGNVFEVQGGCAGLGYALVAIALAAFCNLLERRRWRSSAALLLFGLLLALVGNWVRIFVTVAVGKSELQNLFVVLVRDHHLLFGWIVFGLFMVPLVFVDRLLQSRRYATERAAAASDGGTRLESRLAGAYAVAAVLALGIWLNQRVAQGDDAAAATVFVAAAAIPGWQRVDDWQDARRPHYVGASAQWASWYADGAVRVGAYVAHYGVQRPEHEVVFLGNQPQGQAAAVVMQQRVTVATDTGASMRFQELEVADSSAERRLVWVGLRVAGSPADGELAAKALQIVGALRGRRDAQAIVLTAAGSGECGGARSALTRFAAAGAGPLDAQAETYLTRQ
jgi:EpsI family protein